MGPVLAFGWDPPAIIGSIRDGVASRSLGTLAWVQGNHDDQSLAVTRFGCGAVGHRLARSRSRRS